ncbi:hypothetical protein ACFXI8_00940 [Streptomyces niveus]|uniref:hypothetical protein n=1 Tax=Streptomyces niveus TaxID=193462 RepID=UPI00367802C6
MAAECPRAAIPPGGIAGATRPGHSLTVAYRTYAKILRGLQTHSTELIAAGLRYDDS